MEINLIFENFTYIVSQDFSLDYKVAYKICENAMHELISMLKDTTDPADPRLVKAAAGIAYYEYALYCLTNPNEPESLKAGDVSIKNNKSESLNIAKTIKDAGLDGISDLIVDKSFGVWSV